MVPFEIAQQLQAGLRAFQARRARPAEGAEIGRACPPAALPSVLPPLDVVPLDATSEDPTPDEIRRACEQIQATWSDQERRLRANVRRPTDLDERGDAGTRFCV